MTLRPTLLFAAAFGLAPLAGAQSENPDHPEFDEPTRIVAGEKYLGEGRLYPSPVFHDVNGNGEMDTNLLGLPLEPWGVSNNAKSNFGPPSWEDIRFEIPAAGTQQTIELNH